CRIAVMPDVTPPSTGIRTESAIGLGCGAEREHFEKNRPPLLFRRHRSPRHGEEERTNGRGRVLEMRLSPERDWPLPKTVKRIILASQPAGLRACRDWGFLENLRG